MTPLPGPFASALPGLGTALENVIERAMIHSTGAVLLVDEAPDLPLPRACRRHA
jgi:hypothetical protein